MSNQLFPKLKPVLESDLKKAQSRLDILTKPHGSLGKLEELAKRYVAIRRGNSNLDKKSIFVFSGDHGVTEEGVSAYPKKVTQQMIYNFLSDGAAINVLARHVKAEVNIVDMGVDHDFKSIGGIIKKKIDNGTQNMVRGPAMTRQQAVQSLQIGFDLAAEWSLKGTDIFAAGEMGIGNSTSAAAITAAFDDSPIELVTGKGTGANKIILKKKIEAIRKALQINKPNPNDPLEVLSKLGGFEIGGMAGLILGAAEREKAIIVDGLISGAAAIIAYKMDSIVSDYVFTSHQSTEPGHNLFFKLYNQAPLFDFKMRLGEGTGAALGIGILESALKIYNEMATFQSAGISHKNSV